jgi:hypothetical protein
LSLPGDFLFLDESGDLGLAAGSTPVFAVGILHLNSQNALKRAIKRARRTASVRHAPLNEMKWSKSSQKVRMAVIEQILREGSLISGISACVIDKTWMDKAFTKRREEVRYNYAVRLALQTGGLFATTAKRRIQLTIDARNRRATDILREYVELLMANEEISCLL